MDKNLLLAVALSMGVYALWFGFIEKRVTPPAAVSSVAASSSARPTGEASQPQVAAAPAPTQTAVPIDLDALKREASLVQAGQTELSVHPKGAAVVSASYKGPLGAVELVAQPRPGLFATFPDLDFKAPAPGRFAARHPEGLMITKEFLPGSESQLPRIRVTISNASPKALEAGGWTLSLGPGLGTVASELEENESLSRAIALTTGGEGTNGKVEVLSPGEHSGPYRWVGVDNRYFLAAVVAPEGFKVLSREGAPSLGLQAPSAALAPKAQVVWEFPYYVGAKATTELLNYKAGLERSIDFGFFAQLGRWVLQALNKLYGITGNWGWSIVLLTVGLQIILFPLTYKSLKAAAAMKNLQPEIAKLQQKYSKEPARLNTEMMDLYKKTGANPLGGCLPMLLQMPVFIALFNALRNSWELHGQPWIFWIYDLSARDPFYVLPVVMGALMVVQARFNPITTADPAQAKMMQWMPVIFTFMFLKFPAGLVLYWLTNSLISTIQQLALRDHFDK